MKLENTLTFLSFLPLTFVSFLGVLPLWVIPAKALGTAPSAPADDNLKYLLAFAGEPLFCLVVLSLLPFAPFLSAICKPLYSWRLTW